MNQLPIYKIHNKFYYRDERLGEYRNVEDIDDTIPLDTPIAELEKPDVKDREALWKKILKR